MITLDDVTFSRVDIERMGRRDLAGLSVSVTPGMRLAVRRDRTADWLSLFFALREIGASVLPIHPSTPVAAARRMAERARCRWLLHGDEAISLSEATSDEAVGGCLLQTSSGTTGEPRPIARPWSDIAREVESYVAAFVEPRAMQVVLACPLTHSYGLICGLLACLHRGQRPIVLDTGNPKHVLSRALGERDTLIYASPALLETMCRLLPAGRTLDAVMTSGTVLPPRWFDLLRRSTRRLYQQYGCSEAGCIAVNRDVRAPQDMGEVLPHHTLRCGTAENPEEIVVGSGEAEIRTGDLGYRRADGTLVFVTRLDDMINVAGLNVHPADVEEAVMVLPSLTDAVAFRVADPFAGERVGLAFVATEPVSAADLRAHCQRHLANHQVPTHYIRLPRLPRQANGKISRRALAADFAGGATKTGAEAAR